MQNTKQLRIHNKCNFNNSQKEKEQRRIFYLLSYFHCRKKKRSRRELDTLIDDNSSRGEFQARCIVHGIVAE